MPTSTAAWIRAAHPGSRWARRRTRRPDQTRSSSAITPSPSTRSRWNIQATGALSYRWLSYPTVLGSDVAGVVVDVGSTVTRCGIGDQVLAHAVGTEKDTTTRQKAPSSSSRSRSSAWRRPS